MERYDRWNDDTELKVILGCGGHALHIADVILCSDPKAQILFVDESASEDEYKLGFPVVKELPTGRCRYIIGIGDNAKRKKKFEELKREQFFTVISPLAYVGHMTSLGTGCFVSHMSTVCVEAVIGDNSALATASVISHHCRLGRHCFVGPHATVAGCSELGDMVFIGAGATVIDKVKICSGVIVGAGASVVNDITVPGTYVGTPARRIK